MFRVALIGGHTIYKIDDTDIIPIANEQTRSRIGNPDEAKYDSFSSNRREPFFYVYW